MTLSEFKAWFEGFTESMDGPPSLKQWERIQARVKEISGTPISYPVYIDRYRPYWAGPILTGGPLTAYGCNSLADQNTMLLSVSAADTKIGGTHLGADGHMAKFSEATFDSHAAMNTLGRADAEALKAA